MREILTESFALMGLEAFLARYRVHGVLNIEVNDRDWESKQRRQEKIRPTLEMIGLEIRKAFDLIVCILSTGDPPLAQRLRP
ncbi:MAG: hypothetical protein ABSB19_04685 [Methylomonas sp.]|jgi:hypothetical protein